MVSWSQDRRGSEVAQGTIAVFRVRPHLVRATPDKRRESPSVLVEVILGDHSEHETNEEIDWCGAPSDVEI